MKKMANKTEIFSYATVLAILTGFITLSDSGLFDPLNMYIFKTYTVPQWMAMFTLISLFGMITVGAILKITSPKQAIQHAKDLSSTLGDLTGKATSLEQIVESNVPIEEAKSKIKTEGGKIKKQRKKFFKGRNKAKSINVAAKTFPTVRDLIAQQRQIHQILAIAPVSSGKIAKTTYFKIPEATKFSIAGVPKESQYLWSVVKKTLKLLSLFAIIYIVAYSLSLYYY
jgi:hypothetical protein